MKVYDSDIRYLLYDCFKDNPEYAAEQDTVVINELDVCSGVARVDIAVVNGKLHGYEIKSGQDTLERLPQQIEFYNTVFDSMTIVAHQTHIDKVKKIVPIWWEIQCVYENKKEQIKIKRVRKGKQNSNINIRNVAMLLWKDEMLELIENYSSIKKGYKSKTRNDLSELIATSINPEVVLQYVRKQLKQRINWRAVPLQELGDDLHSM